MSFLRCFSEGIALQAGHILQRDAGAVCQDQDTLYLVDLLQPPGGGDIRPAAFSLVRTEPGYGDLRPLRDVFKQNGLPPIQLRSGVLIQFQLPIREPSGLRNGGGMAG